MKTKNNPNKIECSENLSIYLVIQNYFGNRKFTSLMHYVKKRSVVDKALIQTGCVWQCLGLKTCTTSEGDMRKEMGLTVLHLSRYKSVSVHQNRFHVWAGVQLPNFKHSQWDTTTSYLDPLFSGEK